MLLQVQTRFVSFSYSCLVGDMLLHPGPCLLQSTGTLSGDQAAKLMSAPQPPFHPNHQDHHQHTSRHSVDLHTHRCHISKPQHHCTEQKIVKLLLFKKKTCWALFWGCPQSHSQEVVNVRLSISPLIPTFKLVSNRYIVESQ